MNKHDAKLLKHVRREKLVGHDSLILRHDEGRLESNKEYLGREYRKIEPILTGLPPPYDKSDTEFAGYTLNEYGKVALKDYEAETREKWFKFWFTVIIPLLALAVSVVALVVGLRC